MRVTCPVVPEASTTSPVGRRGMASAGTDRSFVWGRLYRSQHPASHARVQARYPLLRLLLIELGPARCPANSVRATLRHEVVQIRDGNARIADNTVRRSAPPDPHHPGIQRRTSSSISSARRFDPRTASVYPVDTMGAWPASPTAARALPARRQYPVIKKDSVYLRADPFKPCGRDKHPFHSRAVVQPNPGHDTRTVQVQHGTLKCEDNRWLFSKPARDDNVRRPQHRDEPIRQWPDGATRPNSGKQASSRPGRARSRPALSPTRCALAVDSSEPPQGDGQWITEDQPPPHKDAGYRGWG